jgi:hypothetical protein
MATQPTEQERADLSIQRGKDAAQIKDPEQRKAFVAEQGKQEAKGKDFSDIVNSTNAFETGMALKGSFKHGGTVPETGPYLLHEGEKVIPVAETKRTPAERHSFHRAMAKLHTGALHRHFGIAEDQPIPHEKKVEAANSDNPHTAKMGHMALAMEGWKHGGKK